MPLYDYECKRCGKTRERFYWLRNRKRNLKCECGGFMSTIISTTSKPNVVDEWDETLEARVTGPEHRRKLMKERQLVER